MSVLRTDDDASLLCADSIRSRSCGVQVSPPCCLDDGVDTFHDKLQRENTAGSDGSATRQPVQSVRCTVVGRGLMRMLLQRKSLEVAVVPNGSKRITFVRSTFLTSFLFSSCAEYAAWHFCMAFSLTSPHHISAMRLCNILINADNKG